MKNLIILIFIFLAICQANSYWEKTKGPYGGRITSINLIDNFVYVGTANSGVYCYDIENELFFDLNFDIQNKNGIVKIVKNKDLIYLVCAYKVYVKPLIGGKWTLLNLNRTDDYKHVFMDILFIGDTILCTTTFGLVFSPDLGATWEYRNEGIPGLYGDYLALKDDTLLFMGAIGSLYYSTDMGVEWIEFDLDINTINLLKVIDNNIYFASVTPLSFYHLGLFKSTDNGQTWLNIGLEDKYVTDLAVVGDKIYASTRNSGILVSDYNNQTDEEVKYNWTEINQGLINPNTSNPLIIHKLEVFEGNIWAGTDTDGIYELKNGNDTWDKLEYIKVPVYSNAVCVNKNILYCGTEGNGIFTSNNWGDSWDKFNIGLNDDWNISKKLEVFDNKVYTLIRIMNQFNWIYVYNEIEEKWNCLSENLSNLHITDFAVIDNRIFLSTNSGFYISENDGQTWLKNESEELNTNIQSVTNIDSTIFIKTNSGIFKSLDFGETFEMTSNIVGSKIMNSGTNLYLRATQELYLSTDMGSNWNSILSLTEPDERFQAIGIYKNIIFVSTFISNFNSPGDGRVIYTVNDGVEWNDISAGLYNTSSVRDFTFWGDEVIAATDAGVYLAKLSDFGIEVSVVENDIEQMDYLYTYLPYPIPGRSEIRTKIYFASNTEFSTDNITIYNINGNKLHTTENLSFEQETFYSGNLIWDCSGVEPGVYIIRINHGTQVKTVKVMKQL